MARQADRPGRRPAVRRRHLENLIFRKAPLRRFTQDSPILPDVWFEYGRNPDARVDLLLTPMRNSRPGLVFKAVRHRLQEERATAHWEERHGDDPRAANLAYSQSTVAVRLWFDELVRVVLPLSAWQNEYMATREWLGLEGDTSATRQELAEALVRLEQGDSRPDPRDNAIWMVAVIGTIELARTSPDAEPAVDEDEEDDGLPRPISLEEAELLVEAVSSLLADAPAIEPEDSSGGGDPPIVFSVSRNRTASATVWRSVPAVKADAARRLFDLRCDDLQWAVLDSGIDARHPAFRARNHKGEASPEAFLDDGGRPANRTRVVATYDFTRIRELLDPDLIEKDEISEALRRRLEELGEQPEDLMRHLYSGRQIDWNIFGPFLQIEHQEDAYRPPVHAHGTHVAGILAGDWRVGDPEADQTIEQDMVGLCRDLQLYDLRVLNQEGRGDEFSIIAALQFVRHLNAHKDHIVVHGVNLSLSIPHDVANYACGRTPICEECERLVSTGVIVVAPAGNEGYMQHGAALGRFNEGYRNISITDPGNAEGVITVGATHRYRPHTYGVSYFSSRGPTGDGRSKPDLVAPGEKIWSAVPDRGVKTLDGTSMAAPHVSGSAALLLARHRELVGQPERVKRILCKTATDLGRERYFQGSGMVDVLRAIQSV
jgi:serine protease AprX